jgi:hypothetical protein
MNWNKYPETKPQKYGTYLVYWEKADKWHKCVWNGGCWAYDNNSVTHWIDVDLTRPGQTKATPLYTKEQVEGFAEWIDERDLRLFEGGWQNAHSRTTFTTTELFTQYLASIKKDNGND